MGVKDKRFLLVGCGSIGRRHIKNLAALGARSFLLCDLNEDRLVAARGCLPGNAEVEFFTDYDLALTRDPDAVLICTPSSMHCEMSMKAARCAVNLFIEKPLSHSIDGVAELIETVNENKLVAAMAMCYRFHPVLLRLKAMLDDNVLGRLYHANCYGGYYLPYWHPDEDYRREYAAQKNLGGGVILTSIHGFDNLRWLFGEVELINAIVDRVGDLEMDVEDMALGTFKMKSGLYISWQTDFLRKSDEHMYVIVGEQGTLRCNVLEGLIEHYCAQSRSWSSERIAFDVNSMYVSEMESFVNALESGSAVAVDLDEGRRTLRLALDIKAQGGY
ncbi:hypothetical protein MNBD_DELTA01-357 [hydrothermal vent metagenome]|uniref:Gfo/Idh/MocA family oxidoreductase n=1 Tax=hydrothermal vent metagenome TaxID=652676 RepID=A0A3B0QVG8_9ZZZZ